MRKVPFMDRFTPLGGPIALVTTVDEQGWVNVAPMSWISHVCRKPSLFILGSHRTHHTVRNLLANGECVLNFPTQAMAPQAWAAHRYLEPSPAELGLRGFTAVPAEKVAPPRLQECPAHMEGRVESVKWYGDECIFFIEEVARSVDEAVAAAPDPYALLRPIFYLGEGTYGTVERSQKIADPTDDFVRYVITLIPKPETRLTPPLIRAHVAHLRQLDAAGRLVLCGPFEGGGGMAIIRAASLEEAQALAAADPFVSSGQEDYTVRKWELSCEANNHMGFGD